jgi:hypothetical protein
LKNQKVQIFKNNKKRKEKEELTCYLSHNGSGPWKEGSRLEGIYPTLGKI